MCESALILTECFKIQFASKQFRQISLNIIPFLWKSRSVIQLNSFNNTQPPSQIEYIKSLLSLKR